MFFREIANNRSKTNNVISVAAAAAAFAFSHIFFLVQNAKWNFERNKNEEKYAFTKQQFEGGGGE